MVLPKATWKNKYGILLLLHKIHVFFWHTDVRDNGIFTKVIEGENQTQTFQHKPRAGEGWRLECGIWGAGSGVPVSAKPSQELAPSPLRLNPGALWLGLHPVLGEHADPSCTAISLSWRAAGSRPWVGVIGNRFPLTPPWGRAVTTPQKDFFFFKQNLLSVRGAVGE